MRICNKLAVNQSAEYDFSLNGSIPLKYPILALEINLQKDGELNLTLTSEPVFIRASHVNQLMRKSVVKFETFEIIDQSLV